MITNETGAKILRGQSVRLRAVASDTGDMDVLVARLREAMRSQRTGSNVVCRGEKWHISLEIGKLQDGELALVISALTQTPLDLLEPEELPPQQQQSTPTTDK